MEFAYNNAQQSSTGYSPFFLNHGHHPIVPANVHKSPVPAAEDFTLQMKNLLKIAQDNISQAQARQAKYANQHRREETFQEGDSVLISSENINLPSQALRPTKKFQARYIGPYQYFLRSRTMLTRSNFQKLSGSIRSSIYPN